MKFLTDDISLVLTLLQSFDYFFFHLFSGSYVVSKLRELKLLTLLISRWYSNLNDHCSS